MTIEMMDRYNKIGLALEPSEHSDPSYCISNVSYTCQICGVFVKGSNFGKTKGEPHFHKSLKGFNGRTKNE